MTPRDWRDAKLPQWVRDSAQKEIDQWRLTAALSWPTQAKPEPLPFRWGDYDRLIGAPYSGTFWAVARNRIDRFDLRKIQDLQGADRNYIGGGETWKAWAFRKSEGGRWHTSVVRGPLFDSEADARLYRRWLLCEDFARQLLAAM